MLILNLPIHDPSRLVTVWSKASGHVCADGGANRLYHALSDDEREHYIPDAISGDFDSLEDEVREYYQSRGVDIRHDPDQYSTDFGKCMKYIAERDELAVVRDQRSIPRQPMSVVVLGGFGGRVDQSFHSIQALYYNHNEERLEPFTGIRELYLVSEESITFLLEPGKNLIATPQHLVGPTCGIIPVGGPATIRTAGFEWNLEDAETRFGGMVSTSNHIKADSVFVQTDEPIVFTMELGGFRRRQTCESCK